MKKLTVLFMVMLFSFQYSTAEAKSKIKVISSCKAKTVIIVIKSSNHKAYLTRDGDIKRWSVLNRYDGSTHDATIYYKKEKNRFVSFKRVHSVLYLKRYNRKRVHLKSRIYLRKNANNKQWPRIKQWQGWDILVNSFYGLYNMKKEVERAVARCSGKPRMKWNYSSQRKRVKKSQQSEKKKQKPLGKDEVRVIERKIIKWDK